MTRRLIGAVGLGCIVVMLGLESGWAAEAKVAMRSMPASPNSGFITVRLDDYANDPQGLPFATNQITVNGVPFGLIGGQKARSVFLKDVGWRYLEFPLPGNYPGEGYHWPCSSQWRYSGDGVVKYPLTFKKLVVTLPEKVLQLTEYAPVSRPEIYLKDLMVSYEPPDVAFAAE